MDNAAGEVTVDVVASSSSKMGQGYAVRIPLHRQRVAALVTLLDSRLPSLRWSHVGVMVSPVDMPSVVALCAAVFPEATIAAVHCGTASASSQPPAGRIAGPGTERNQ